MLLKYFCEVLFILTKEINVVAHTCNTNVKEVEAEGSRVSVHFREFEANLIMFYCKMQQMKSENLSINID